MVLGVSLEYKLHRRNSSWPNIWTWYECWYILFCCSRPMFNQGMENKQTSKQTHIPTNPYTPYIFSGDAFTFPTISYVFLQMSKVIISLVKFPTNLITRWPPFFDMNFDCFLTNIFLCRSSESVDDTTLSATEESSELSFQTATPSSAAPVSGLHYTPVAGHQDAVGTSSQGLRSEFLHQLLIQNKCH